MMDERRRRSAGATGIASFGEVDRSQGGEYIGVGLMSVGKLGEVADEKPAVFVPAVAIPFDEQSPPPVSGPATGRRKERLR